MRAFLGESLNVDALRSDAYVESLLLSAERRAPAVPTDLDLDPEVAATALLLQSTLVRVHPSFRFEERLAQRLADVAAAMRRAAATPHAVPANAPVSAQAGDGSLLAFPGHSSPSDGSVEGSLRDLGVVAITSAAISIGAAAVVAWRRGRLRRGIA